MKLVEKTCQNPDCGHVEDLPEEQRSCPKCDWEVRPWDFYRGSKKKGEESWEQRMGSLGFKIEIKKKKRRVGLICPNCGHEYPGWRSKVWANHERMALAEEKRKEDLKKGIRGCEACEKEATREERNGHE